MIDFHAHLDLYPDPAGVVREATARGIYVLSVTTTPSAWDGTSALGASSPRIRTALGLHPQIAHERVSELPLFDDRLPQAPYIGEIGLDGGPELKQHWQVQLKVFDHILQACSSSGGRVMSIHSRRAAPAVLERLQVFPDAGTPILHWFSGSKRDLSRAIDMGCWFSVGPSMLLAEKARLLVKEIPKERVLTESDGPFAVLNGTAAMPWDAARAIPELAALWNVSLADAGSLLHENLRSLGRLGARSN